MDIEVTSNNVQEQLSAGDCVGETLHRQRGCSA